MALTQVQGAMVGPTGFANLSGITFPATQVPSADANTLDDYEEGTWTPTVKDNNSTTVTVSVAIARYTKIGRMVTCILAFDRNDAAALTGAVTFNLPFSTQANSPNYIAYGTFWAINAGNAFSSGVVVLDNYANDIGNLVIGYNSSTISNLNFGSTSNTLNNNGRLLCSFTYETN
jgi:hypothetical protein